MYYKKLPNGQWKAYVQLFMRKGTKHRMYLKPGITGWAQVCGRDELSIADKVALDVEYLNRQSFWFDMKILWMTLLKVINGDGVSH